MPAEYDLEAAVLRVESRHYHVEEDEWYCCGACEGCADDGRRGECTCDLEARQQRIRDEICAAYRAGLLRAAGIARGHIETSDFRTIDTGRLWRSGAAETVAAAIEREAEKYSAAWDLTWSAR